MVNLLNFIYNLIDVIIISSAYIFYRLWYVKPESTPISYWASMREVITISLQRYSMVQKTLMATIIFVTPSLVLSYSIDLKHFREFIAITLFIYLIFENSDLLFSMKQKVVKSVMGFERLLSVLSIILAIQNIYLMDEIGGKMALKLLVLFLMSITIIFRLSSPEKSEFYVLKLDSGLWSFVFVQFINIYIFKYIFTISIPFVLHFIGYLCVQCVELLVLWRFVSIFDKIQFRKNYIDNGRIQIYIILIQMFITMRILI